MNKTEKMMSQAAQGFVKRRDIIGYKKGESQAFWPEWYKTHRDNDLAVVAAYNCPTTLTESDLVAHLFTLHTQLTKL